MSKLQTLCETLRRRLETRCYPVGSRFPSEYQLAEEFGVDKTTVNKAVGLLVEHGLLFRGPRGSGTRVRRECVFPKGQIAFVAELAPFTMKILNGAQQAALSRGYLLSVVSPPRGELARYMDELDDSIINGIICDEASAPRESFRLPCINVDVDYAANDRTRHLVNSNNLQGGRLMMAEIIRRGHREITLYSTGRIHLDRQNRIRGFHEIMSQAGIDHIGKRTFFGDEWSLEDAVRSLKTMRENFPGLSIIVCDSDAAAAMLLNAARSLGLSLPGGIALTGYGNVIGDYGNFFPIANIKQHPFRIGSCACQRLIDIIENGAPPEPIREYLEPELINPELIPDLTAASSR